MAALICYICSLVKNTYEFSEIYIRGGSTIAQSLELLRYRQQLQSFAGNLRLYHRRKALESYCSTKKSSAMNGSNRHFPSAEKCDSSKQMPIEMPCTDIDYTAVEASLFDCNYDNDFNKLDNLSSEWDLNCDYVDIWNHKVMSLV